MINDYILQRIKELGLTKTAAAERIGMTKSTFHQKTLRNTFTAKELLTLAKVFKFSLDDLLAESQATNEVKQLDILPIHARPTVQASELMAYESGGVCFEETYDHGSLLYVPHGILPTIFETLSLAAQTAQADLIAIESALRDETLTDSQWSHLEEKRRMALKHLTCANQLATLKENIRYPIRLR